MISILTNSMDHSPVYTFNPSIPIPFLFYKQTNDANFNDGPHYCATALYAPNKTALELGRESSRNVMGRRVSRWSPAITGG